MNDTKDAQINKIPECYKPSSGLYGLSREQLSNDTLKLIEELFTYHRWDAEQNQQGAAISYALAHAYFTIVQNVPVSPSRTRALNALTDARMLANQAITFRGAV